jgi:hypothetical protein
MSQQPAPQPFEYAVLRLAPRVERGEFMNIGVVVISRPQRYLAARVALDDARLSAFAPWLTPEERAEIAETVALIPRICAGDPDAGPIARLSLTERWHWIVAPSSSMIQAGPVHTGLCASPEQMLERVFDEQVAVG